VKFGGVFRPGFGGVSWSRLIVGRFVLRSGRYAERKKGQGEQKKDSEGSA
jgi:hypothetical protein